MRRHATVLLACAALIVTLSLGLRAAMGLFLKPISADLALGREVYSFALALCTLLTGIGGPVIGAISDRYGAALVTAIGGAVLVIGLWLASFVEGALAMQLTFGVLIGLGSTMTSMGIVMGAIARVVSPNERSVAFGIIMGGGSIGQFLMIPYTQQILSNWDWRVTCIVLAVTMAAIIPLSLGLRLERGPQGTRPQGPANYRIALAEAWNSKGFWLLTMSFFVCGFHVSFIQTHLPAYLSDRGLSGNVAAIALALVGLFNVFGSLGAGFLGARYKQPYLLAMVYFLRSLVFLALIVLPLTPALALVFSACMGLLYLSTAAPTSAMVASIFGPKYFAMINGFVFMSHQIGGFVGSWLGGWVFDTTGSYMIIWWVSVGLGLIATALAAPINDNPIHRPAAAAG